MAYNLTIDRGNTAAKVAVWDGDMLKSLTIETELSGNVISRLVATLDAPVSSAIYCSVATPGKEIEQMLRPFVGRVMHVNSAMPLPISIDYGTPGTLGEDRIASAVAAQSMFPGQPLLVVDAGTAVTYDAVTADGHFIGGNIAPGISMRLQALHHFTARLPQVEMPRKLGCKEVFGHDTRSAMVLGAIYGIIGSVAYYRSKLPESTRVVMTGGWARELSKLCDFPVEIDPDLVSRGLNRILLYNE